MDPFTMVVAIVAVSVGAGVINNAIKAKASRQTDVEMEGELTSMRADVARLQERVRVLEKIVTDNDRQLAEDIRRLA